MYGLEKDKEKDKEKGKRFAFDLEKEIKENPKKGKETIELAEKRIQEIKTLLREGTNEKDFDHLGTLLLGYTSLQKVLKRIKT